MLGDQGKRLGCVCIDFKEESDDVQISGFINPNYWHQGLFLEIHKEIIHYLYQRHGCTGIVISVSSDNERACQILTKLGYMKGKSYSQDIEYTDYYIYEDKIHEIEESA